MVRYQMSCARRVVSVDDPHSSFLFNSIIDVLMEVSFLTSDFTGIDLNTGKFLADLEYTDHIIVSGEQTDNMPSLLNTLNSQLTPYMSLPQYPTVCKGSSSLCSTIWLSNIVIKGRRYEKG
ncbi:unnamed protein product [Heterobilharzia americana]|nr:unnamed protein product [Heterobilharzia americana]CAH8626177.1 unnamed protein product [Heterobilharzia americana]